jgi:acrylyl-CoA reductase (NADPH)
LDVGREVVVTGYELGAGSWGGWAELIRVPAEWVVPLPAGLTLRESMILGTAGFTAAQAVEAMRRRGIPPEKGEVAVTGASGGVGTLAVALLAKLGYRVAAVTGKPAAHDLLRRLGAATVLDRADVCDATDRPLLATRWAAAVDTVGGQTLATLVRSTGHRGLVAACGLVGGVELRMTVYPFLLRGVTLAGIDSAHCPMPERLEIWRKLSQEWNLPCLDDLATFVGLEGLEEKIGQILAGQIVGRTVVTLARSAATNG